MHQITKGSTKTESMTNQAKSNIRFLHASPGAPAVDVYANDKKIASNLAYKQFTKYLSIPTGQYNITVYPAGRRDKPVLKRNVNVPAGTIYTVAAAGKFPTVELVSIPEPKQQIPQGMALVRFVHLSPGAPNVDVRLPDGAMLFQNIGYKEMSKYSPIKPGRHTFDLYPTGTDKRILTVPNINLKANQIYSIYATGLVDSTEYPLIVLIPLDGSTYL